MDLAARKHSFIQELDTVDENLLERLENFLRANRKDWFTVLSAEEQDEIEIGLAQADEDEFVSNQTVMDKFAKWH